MGRLRKKIHDMRKKVWCFQVIARKETQESHELQESREPRGSQEPRAPPEPQQQGSVPEGTVYQICDPFLGVSFSNQISIVSDL